MPFVCFPTRIAPSGLPTPPHHHRVGHSIRRVLRHWGAPASAWHCVWVAPAIVGAGGVAWGVGRVWGATGAPLAAGAVVTVPEVSSLWLLGVGLVVLGWVRR
jgi:hypothetical protein